MQPSWSMQALACIDQPPSTQLDDERSRLMPMLIAIRAGLGGLFGRTVQSTSPRVANLS
jgi:hypothetical protein